MKRIITIAGSNSQNSMNQMLVDHASNLLSGVEVISIDLNDYVLPIFGVDYEAENGIPASVKRLSNVFDGADGFIVSLAEHNGSYSAVFKNTIDWLSRIDMKVWRDKPMLLMATSPGGRGGATVLQLASAYFPFMGAHITDTFSLPSFYDNFKDGEIQDEGLKEDLYTKVAKYQSALKELRYAS